MANTFQLGQGYKLFFGLGASAPTTPADPENSSVVQEVAEIGDTLTFDRSRSNVERRGRNDPNARYVLPGDRTESITVDINFDTDSNAGYADMETAYNSDTQGTGAAGNIGYFAISNNVASDPLIHGQAAVASLPLDFGRQAVISSSVSLDVNGDATKTTHN